MDVNANYTRNNTDFIGSTVGKDMVFMNMKTGDYIGFNPIAADIWNLLSEPKSAIDLVSSLTKEYDVAEELCMQDTCDCLEKMLQQHMITEL